MPSSHRQHRQDKSVGVCGVNWIGDKSRLVHKSFTPQTRLDTTVQSPIYWGLLKTVCDCRQLTSHCRRWRDETFLSCRCRRCELGIIRPIIVRWMDVVSVLCLGLIRVGCVSGNNILVFCCILMHFLTFIMSVTAGLESTPFRYPKTPSSCEDWRTILSCQMFA